MGILYLSERHQSVTFYFAKLKKKNEGRKGFQDITLVNESDQQISSSLTQPLSHNRNMFSMIKNLCKEKEQFSKEHPSANIDGNCTDKRTCPLRHNKTSKMVITVLVINLIHVSSSLIQKLLKANM